MATVKIVTPFYTQFKEYMKNELENFKSWNPTLHGRYAGSVYKLQSSDENANWKIELCEDHMIVQSEARYVHIRHGLKIDMHNARIEITGASI